MIGPSLGFLLARTVRATATSLATAWLAAGCGSKQVVRPPAETGTFFASGQDSLHYTLDIPSGSGPFPAFALVHGSGRQTKEFNRVISQPLVDRGFIALRYDKQGVGLSSGTYRDVGVANSDEVLPHLADDAAAAVDFLAEHPLVDPGRIGLVGVSQAGWIVPNAATKSARVAFTILFVGPTVTVGEEIFYSSLTDAGERDFDVLSAQLAAFSGPFGFDPRPDLDALTTPGLWIFSGADLSIPTRESVAILDDLIASGKPFVYHVYDGFDHCNVSCGAPAWPDVDAWLNASGLVQ